MTRGALLVQVLPDAVLQQWPCPPCCSPWPRRCVHRSRGLLRRVSAPAQSGEGRHARVIPAADMSFLYQLQQLALAHHRIGQIEPGKLDLLRMAGTGELFQKPVVERAVVFEFQGADGMGDPSMESEMAVGVVIHGVDAPVIAGAVVGGAAGCGTCTGSRMFMLGEAISILARSVREPSGNSPARIRRNRSRFSSTERLRYGLSLPGSVSVPRYCLDLVGAQIADIGFACLDELLRHTHRAAQNSPRRNTCGLPSQIPASAHPPEWIPRIPRLPCSDWCRRTAGCTGRCTAAAMPKLRQMDLA